MKQEMMGGSDISWTICKSFTPRSRQPCQCLIFYRHDALADAQQTVSKHWSNSKVTGYSSSHPSLLQELTCHMGSQSVTCHPGEVTFQPMWQETFSWEFFWNQSQLCSKQDIAWWSDVLPLMACKWWGWRHTVLPPIECVWSGYKSIPLPSEWDRQVIIIPPPIRSVERRYGILFFNRRFFSFRCL